MLAFLILAFALVLLSLTGYYFATVGIEKLWYCLVVYVFKYLPHQSKMSVGVHSAITPSATILQWASCLAAYILLPGIYGISLWRCWRSRKSPFFPWDEVALLSLVGLSLLLEVAVSMTWLRLFAISLPGVVLAVWSVGGRQGLHRSVIIAASVVLSGIVAHQVVTKHLLSTSRAELPGGRVATTPQAYEKLRQLAIHTHPGDFFLQAGWPGVYIPLQVRNPLDVPTLGLWDIGSDEEIASFIREMRARRVPYVLWTHSLDEGCGATDCKDFLSPFRTYLRSSYVRIETFQDGDVLWQKLNNRADVSPKTSIQSQKN